MLTPGESNGRSPDGTAEWPADLAGAAGSLAGTVLELDGSPRREVLMEHLRQAIAALPTAERQVLLWHYFEDWPVEEIAGRLGAPAEEVTSLLRRALAQLRTRFRAERRHATVPRGDGSGGGWFGVDSRSTTLLDGEQKEQKR